MWHVAQIRYTEFEVRRIGKLLRKDLNMNRWPFENAGNGFIGENLSVQLVYTKYAWNDV